MPLPIVLFLLSAAEPAGSTGVLWVAGLMAAAGPVSAIVTLVGHFATKREVETLEKRHAESRVEIAQLRDEMGELRDEISEMERRLMNASEVRAVASHERTNEILAAVMRLEGRFDQSQHRVRNPH